MRKTRDGDKQKQNKQEYLSSEFEPLKKCIMRNFTVFSKNTLF